MKHPYMNRIFSIIQTISIIIYICLILIKCQTGNMKTNLFYMNGIDWFTLIKIICWTIILSSIILVLFSDRERTLYLLLKGLTINAILLLIMAGVYGFKKPQYYKLSSPDHLHEVFVQKEYSMFSSDYYFVDYTSDSILHKIQGSISSHSNIIENHLYDITWHNSYAEVKIYDGKERLLQVFKIY